MQKPYLFAVVILCLFSFVSCKKEETGPMQFKVGIDDVNVYTESFFYSETFNVLVEKQYQKVQVTYTGGKREGLNFSLDGLPIGVTASIQVSRNFLQTTATIYYTVSDSAVVGTSYSLVLHVSTPSGINKDVEFNLNVMRCDNFYWHTYTAHGDGVVPYQLTIEPGTVASSAIISNVLNKGIRLQANVDCKGVVVPEQTVNGFVYWGGASKSGGGAPPNLAIELGIAYYNINNPTDTLHDFTEFGYPGK